AAGAGVAITTPSTSRVARPGECSAHAAPRPSRHPPASFLFTVRTVVAVLTSAALTVASRRGNVTRPARNVQKTGAPLGFAGNSRAAAAVTDPAPASSASAKAGIVARTPSPSAPPE